MVICCVIPGKISRYYYVIVEYFKPLRNIFHEMSLTLRYFTIWHFGNYFCRSHSWDSVEYFGGFLKMLGIFPESFLLLGVPVCVYGAGEADGVGWARPSQSPGAWPTRGPGEEPCPDWLAQQSVSQHSDPQISNTGDLWRSKGRGHTRGWGGLCSLLWWLVRPGEDMHGAQVRGVSVSSVRTAGQLLFYFVKCNCANIPRRDQVEENSPSGFYNTQGRAWY